MQKPKTILLCSKATKFVCLLLLLLPSSVSWSQRQVKFPDTLDIGQYLILVEEFDKGGEWMEKENIFKNLNGIGLVYFKCLISYTSYPLLTKQWRNTTHRSGGDMVVSDQPRENEEEEKAPQGIRVRFSDIVA